MERPSKGDEHVNNPQEPNQKADLPKAAEGELDEEQLEGVSGGIVIDWATRLPPGPCRDTTLTSSELGNLAQKVGPTPDDG